jgi:hypothetical protein
VIPSNKALHCLCEVSVTSSASAGALHFQFKLGTVNKQILSSRKVTTFLFHLQWSYTKIGRCGKYLGCRGCCQTRGTWIQIKVEKIWGRVGKWREQSGGMSDQSSSCLIEKGLDEVENLWEKLWIPVEYPGWISVEFWATTFLPSVDLVSTAWPGGYRVYIDRCIMHTFLI